MTTTDLPLVSAIIPTHNRIEWVQESIDSVLNQTYQNIEIIVVDDGSSDGTYEFLITKYGDQLHKLIRNEQPTGCGAAKNLGAKHANGQYIAFLDSDDLWESQKTELAMKLACEPGVAVIGGGCRYIDQHGNQTLRPDKAPKQAAYEDFAIKIDMPGSGSNNLILKTVFDEFGGFNEELLRSQDKDLWVRILSRYQFRFVQEITSVIRIHTTARVNVNLETTLRSRLKSDANIVDSKLRKKASSYTYFVVAQRAWPSDKVLATSLIIKSFLRWPFPIRKDINRLRNIIKMLIGRN